METLLICPARRSEIVVGKFFTVLVFSVSNVLLNLISMGITGKYVVAAARTEALAKMGAGNVVVSRPVGNHVARHFAVAAGGLF